MRKIVMFLVLAFLAQYSIAQVVCGFEGISLDDESYNNNSTTGMFECTNVSLPNSYNEQYFFWSGWAVSNITDNATAGIGNQYASRAGSGDSSDTYALTYAFSGSVLRFSERSTAQTVAVSNSTYAYFSMLEGDTFAKKFGGESGNDPDFFELKVQKYLDGILGSEEVVLNLADYTYSDNSQDYILEGWSTLNLESLGLADSLLFSLSSSDNGDFGMNTPAYFCLDNVVSIPEPIGIEEIEKDNLSLFPNPTNSSFSLIIDEPARLQIVDMNGREVYAENLSFGLNQIDVSGLNPGAYVCVLVDDKSMKTERLVIL